MWLKVQLCNWISDKLPFSPSVTTYTSRIPSSNGIKVKFILWMLTRNTHGELFIYNKIYI